MHYPNAAGRAGVTYSARSAHPTVYRAKIQEAKDAWDAWLLTLEPADREAVGLGYMRDRQRVRAQKPVQGGRTYSSVDVALQQAVAEALSEVAQAEYNRFSTEH